MIVVGVRFKRAGKVYYFDPNDVPVELGQPVVVETARGLELGEVTVLPHEVSEEEVVQPLRKVVRAAENEDLAQTEDNIRLEQEAYAYALERIAALNLEMKLVDVELSFDRSKLIFSFTADQRIDFRELVKELVSRFHTRIELRQIGVRDEAKMLGGLGVCGNPLCCATWIGDFAPVSIRHAKDQDLSMNPNKISGVCGRLKCCLRFEAEAYEDARARAPKNGVYYMTPNGEAKVVAVNLLRENCTMQLSDATRIKVTWVDLQKMSEVKEPAAATYVANEPEVAPLEADAPLELTAEQASAGETSFVPADWGAAEQDFEEHSAPGQNAGRKTAKGNRKQRRSRKKGNRTQSGNASEGRRTDKAAVEREIAAGADETKEAPRKKRRWRKRKPSGNRNHKEQLKRESPKQE
jgi:cell fate regulator YaaT (PSP1 superfamily)